MPIRLCLGSDPTPYATLMWLLLALFLARVLGQVLAATARPRWLPPMARWYSGLMPYRYLLPAQLLIVWLMAAMTRAAASGAGALGEPRERTGVWVLWVSYVYAAGMVARAVRYARQPPDRRGVLIPIVFHFALAGFLFVYGSWHLHPG